MFRGEPELETRLSTVTITSAAKVRFNFKNRRYDPLPEEDMVEDLLTLPSRTHLKEDVEKPPEEKKLGESTSKDETQGSGEEEAEDDEFEGVISKEELRKLDSQPNPFNFSDRVSQTVKKVLVETASQTEPPPSTSFCVNVGLSNIFDAYQRDSQRVRKEKEKEQELKDMDSERGPKPKKTSRSPSPVLESVPLVEPTKIYGEKIKDINKLIVCARTLERMVSQNIYDEITQDFKYWEDGSDEFRPMEGSLLPLWRFSHANSRNLIVSSVSWSPVYPDLFAAGYRSSDISGSEGKGMICLFTLKNPSAPERIIPSNAGVTTVQFHPRLSSILCGGRVDGTVMVYDVKSTTNPVEIKSTIVTGKHLLAVSQVQWIETEPGEDLSFYSVALDGRVTQWCVHGSILNYNDILDFSLQPQPGLSAGQSISSPTSSDRVSLEGCGVCLAFKPDDESVILIGCDTGAIFQCTTIATTHDLTKYNAHNAAVKSIKWNHFNNKVFASCSIDWTIKVWVEFFLSPLVVLDIGSPCAGIDWSPNISTVLVATNDDGKINVFDLFLRKCRPLCVQNLVKKRKLNFTALGFSPFFPVVLVGGNKGYLVTFKLSPNLRKIHKDAKGGDEQRHREVEIAKMDRLIAISRAQV